MRAGSATETSCPGCGLVLPEHDGPTHPYIGASAACWALYGEVLAREYGEQRYPRWHRLTVDAYAAQHPGRPEPRTIRSVAIHLARLCLILERGVAPERARTLPPELLAREQAFRWLEPPETRGTVTVRAVLEAAGQAEHAEQVERWARAVWTAWSPHHDTVRKWLAGVSEGR